MTAEASTVQELSPPQESLHVLTLTPFYPVPGDDAPPPDADLAV